MAEPDWYRRHRRGDWWITAGLIVAVFAVYTLLWLAGVME